MLKSSITLTLFMILCSRGIVIGQIKTVNREKYRIGITQTDKPITIDGILDEEPWKTADHTQKFQRVTPTDTGYAKAQTDVRLTYDKSNLYVGVICWDPTPGKRPVESLRRDYLFTKNDNFMLFLNTYNDQTNGFAFGLSAAGAQTEGLQYDGTKVNYSWDIKWRSKVKSYDDRWVCEISIPFRSIRYLGGDKEWGINFGRLDLKDNEKSAWAPMPRQFPHCSLPFVGSLVWDKPTEKAGLRISLIPYVTGKATKNYEAAGNTRYKYRYNAGFDAKMILSTALNLDLTVNPDYSQVEVDRQQTNLDRYELFFPEKRQFFLENSDLFANLGSETVRPFFSRRIGLARDSTGNLIENRIIGGARLSGNIGNRWRIGVMDMQTAEKNEIQAANYMVAVLQRQVFSRSSISAFIINKQLTGSTDNEINGGPDYNRIAGIEYNLSSPDNRWNGKAYYHQNIHGNPSFKDAAMATTLTFSSQYMTASLGQALTGSGYNAETGYVRRNGYYELFPSFMYKFFPESKRIISHGPSVKLDTYLDPYNSFSMTDRGTQFSYNFEFQNKSTVSADFAENFVKLLEPFDPTNTGGEELQTGKRFSWQEFGATFVSDPRKLLNFTLASRYGGYYNGTRLLLNGELNFRVQPYGSLAMVTTYNNINLPEPYSSAKLLLIGPRFDFTFTDKIFFTSFIQYNSQIDNLNLNMRFQWRFAPVSDLFIVYTENSSYPDYTIKNRGLVIKLSYWFN
jgi:hypothetical protein